MGVHSLIESSIGSTREYEDTESIEGGLEQNLSGQQRLERVADQTQLDGNSRVSLEFPFVSIPFLCSSTPTHTPAPSTIANSIPPLAAAGEKEPLTQTLWDSTI